MQYLKQDQNGKDRTNLQYKTMSGENECNIGSKIKMVSIGQIYNREDKTECSIGSKIKMVRIGQIYNRKQCREKMSAIFEARSIGKDRINLQ